MNKTRSRRLFLSTIGILLWLIFVLPIVFTRYQNEGSDKVEYNPIDNPENGLAFFMSFQSIDPNVRKVTLYSHIIMIGNYSDENGAVTENINCNLRYTKINLVKGNLPDSFTLSIPLLLGSVKDYPFEEFSTLLSIYCQDQLKNHIPVYIIIERSLTSYVPKVEFLEYKDLEGLNITKSFIINKKAINIHLRLHQSKSVKALSIFIVLVMWGLAISYSIIVFDVIYSRREIPPPLLAVGISMLFALPALRNSQPGIPFIGCISDVVGFFWCIAIIAITTMLNLFAFALRWRKPNQLNAV